MPSINGTQMLLTRLVNPFYLWLLRTPLHRLVSAKLLGLSFRGRRTGRPYALPLGYHQMGNRVLIGTDARWQVNFADPHEVALWLGGRRRRGVGAVVTEENELRVAWADLLAARPVLGRLSGIRAGVDGTIDSATLAVARARGWGIVQVRLDAAVPEPDLAGRVVVVSGGTSGIGAATALALAARGATVTVLGRDADRGRDLMATGDPLPGSTRFVQADLSTTAGVREAARNVLAAHDWIDVLVHSAGGHLLDRARNADGVEVNFATNYLSKFLLTELLRPVVADRGRIVVVGSPVLVPRLLLLFDVARGERSVAPLRALVSSGIATAVWTVELARRLTSSGTGVTITNVNPVLVRSGISRTWPWPARLLDRAIMALRGLPAEEGAEPVVYLATAAEVDGVSGRFYQRARPAAVPAAVADRDLGARLWRLSEELTHVAPTGAR